MSAQLPRAATRRLTTWIATVALLAASWILIQPHRASGQQFVDFVAVSPFADGDHWFLLNDLRYDVLDTGVTVVVPAGFVTDFASIPRPFWSLLPRWGKHGAPAVVHDFLYWEQRCTREEADRLIKLAMQENRVGAIRRSVIHAALRIGGALAWRGNAKVREEGLMRIIPPGEYPQDPKMQWKDLQGQLKERGYRPPPRDGSNPKPEYCLRITRTNAVSGDSRSR